MADTIRVIALRGDAAKVREMCDSVELEAIRECLQVEVYSDLDKLINDLIERDGVFEPARGYRVVLHTFDGTGEACDYTLSTRRNTAGNGVPKVYPGSGPDVRGRDTLFATREDAVRALVEHLEHYPERAAGGVDIDKGTADDFGAS